MTDTLDIAAKAAFAHWRNYPQLPQQTIDAAWANLPDAAKAPWIRTARAVIEAIREPTEAMADAGRESGSEFLLDWEGITANSASIVWRAMIDKVLE